MNSGMNALLYSASVNKGMFCKNQLVEVGPHVCVCVCVCVCMLSRVQLLATPWTAAYQAPPPMEFSRQEYWSGFPLPSLPDLHTYV